MALSRGATVLILASALAGCASLKKQQLQQLTLSGRQMASKGAEALQRGRMEDAEQFFGRAVELCPNDERIRCQYADTLWKRGAREAATRHMEEAVRLSGGNAELLVRLGEMYRDQGAIDKAETVARDALKESSQLAAAWALRGDVLRQRGQWDESVGSYHRALSYTPHYPRVQLAVVEIYRTQGRHSRALATLRSLTDGYPAGETPPQVTYLQGLTLKDMGRHAAAAECLEALAKQVPPSTDLLYHLADAQMAAGDHVNARLSLQSALAQTPGHPPSLALWEQLDRQLAAAVDRPGLAP